MSTGITGGGDDEWQLAGDLTIGDITRPVSLALEFGGLGVYPIDGSTHAGFEATTTIDRHDFAPVCRDGSITVLEHRRQRTRTVHLALTGWR